ncbi:MAG: hypothetical protein K6B52_07570 [Clostridiales bacterium]|nr:hypothetical protein [Clostridiales bacterium]
MSENNENILDENTLDDIQTDNQPEEEFDDDKLCSFCHQRGRAPGDVYCGTCKSKLIKTGIPFPAWCLGIITVILSIIAFAYSGILAAPSIQVLKGDMQMFRHNSFSAYTMYKNVQKVADDINTSLDKKTVARVGCNAKLKLTKSIAACRSPLDAASTIQSEYTDRSLDFANNNKTLKGYAAIFTRYQNTYTALNDSIQLLNSENPDYEAVLKSFEESRGKKNVDEIFLDYLICSLAENSDFTSKRILTCYEALDKAAKKSGEDYSWLYYVGYANALYKAKKYDEALSFIDDVLKRNESSNTAAGMKMKISVVKGDIDTAQAVYDRFEKRNGMIDATYVLKTYLLRAKNDSKNAMKTAKQAYEKYQSVPEVYRQLAICYLIDGDYDNAYQNAFLANDAAYCLYYYYGDSSGYTEELSATAYLAAKLCKEYGKGTAESAQYIDNIISSYPGEIKWEKVNAVIDGKMTVKQVFTEGDCDIL